MVPISLTCNIWRKQVAKRPVFQFKITLQGIHPPIWRRIQISDLCTFWDLHVAIQDAMGWWDYHLHDFKVINPITNKKGHMGIDADDDFDILNTLPGWDFKVRDYISANEKMIYSYDYGDGWKHMVEFEGEHSKLKQSRDYPICVDGERACPPEDVGGVPGYENFIIAINDPNHEEHDKFLQWVGGKYDPNKFSPKKVKFDNPRKRWFKAFTLV